MNLAVKGSPGSGYYFKLYHILMNGQASPENGSRVLYICLDVCLALIKREVIVMYDRIFLS